MLAVQQFVRFATVGAVCTAIYAGVYLVLADLVFAPGLAAFAVPPAFLVAVSVGYLLNAAWSFREASADMSPAQATRYLLAQSAGLALNFVLTWIATVPLGLANWTPLVPAILLTPLLTFALQRGWVFR